VGVCGGGGGGVSEVGISQCVCMCVYSIKSDLRASLSRIQTLEFCIFRI